MNRKSEDADAEPVVSPRAAASLGEFTELLGYLRNLWGILAGVSVFFPLSSALAGFIPLKSGDDGGAFFTISPALITTASTVASLFGVLLAYGQRRKIRAHLDESRRHAIVCFVAGAIALVIYLSGEHWRRSGIEISGFDSASIVYVLIEAALMAVYAAIFMAITRAFMVLGMVEFYRPPE